jgi:UDP-glucose 6-dehydrogenase
VKVAVIGAGDIGCVTVACLAPRGHDVLVVDIEVFKVAEITADRSPVLEHLPDMPSMLLASLDASVDVADGLDLCKQVVEPGALRAISGRFTRIFDLEYLP